MPMSELHTAPAFLLNISETMYQIFLLKTDIHMIFEYGTISVQFGGPRYL